MTLDIEKRLADWHSKKYGPVRLLPTFSKLLEEVAELSEEVVGCVDGGRGLSYEAHCNRLAMEAADCAIVLTHLCRGVGRSLVDAVEQKLTVIEERLVNPDAGR